MAIVVASKASILLRVAVPEESVRISVPLIEIPKPVLKSMPPSSISNTETPSGTNRKLPSSAVLDSVKDLKLIV